MASKETYGSKIAYQNRLVAESYLDSRFAHPRGKKENEATHLALESALEVIPGEKRILDMPCGSGRFTQFFHQKGYVYIGADVSMEMVEVAKKQGGGGRAQYFLRCDGEQLPFKDGAFDCVVCVRFLNHHIPDIVRQNVLREMRRISKRWLILQSQHLRFLGPFVQLKVLVRKVFGRDVAKYRFHREVERAGWKEERRVWIQHLNRYIGVYQKV